MLNTEPARVLVVDDEEVNRQLLGELLEMEGYILEYAEDGFEAIAKSKLEIDTILLDVMMPNIDGFEVLRQIRENPVTAEIPVLMVTALDGRSERIRAAELGANEFITKPVDSLELRVRVSGLVRLKRSRDELQDSNARLEARVAHQTAELREALTSMAASKREIYEAHLDSIRRLAVAAEYKDEDTSSHIHRMAHYASKLGMCYGLTTGEVDILHYGSLMHDVGKIGIPDEILLKPGPLTPGERERMETHTLIGARILGNSNSELFRVGEIVARSHHERWNGTGYPAKLSGSDIPLFGRICAIADVFDALTSKRPYKPAFTSERSIEIMQAERGKHFDPDLLDTFVGHFESIVGGELQASYSFDRIIAEKLSD